MELYGLIKPTGIAAFILFLAACVNGIPRLRLLRYHAASGYACCAVTVVHSVIALVCRVYDPVGMLASLGMLFTTLSGYLRWRLGVHILLSLLTLACSVLHIMLVW